MMTNVRMQGMLPWLLSVSLVVCACLAPRLTVATPSPEGTMSMTQPLARVMVVDRLGAPIPDDFDGLSMEYPAVPAYLGETTSSPNRAVRQLLANLGAGSLRIGGDSEDTSCWGVSSPSHARGCAFTITPSLLRVLFSTAAAVHWSVIVGLNLARADPAAAHRYVVDGIVPALGGATLLGLEIGNEPDEYSNHGLRPAGYSLPRYLREFDGYADVLARDPRARMLPLVGPAFVTTAWDHWLNLFLAGERAARLRLVALHYYPFSACGTRDAAGATPDALLSAGTIATMTARFAPSVASARAHGLALQMDELNSVSCHGKAGASDTFAGALWYLDTLFTLARLGVARVNVHIYDLVRSPGRYNPIVAAANPLPQGGWSYTTSVRPLYYAMLLFGRTAGRRFMPVTVTGTRANLKAYAVGDAAQARIFLLNKDPSARGTVIVALPGARGPATVTILRAPSLIATAGTTLGGRTVDARTGVLPAPNIITVRPDPRTATYSVNVPVASAVMVSINRSPARSWSPSTASPRARGRRGPTRARELSATDADHPLGPPQSLRQAVTGAQYAGPGRASRVYGGRAWGGPSRNVRRRLFTSPGGPLGHGWATRKFPCTRTAAMPVCCRTA